jgi:ferredoxin-NADP reductase
MPTPLKLPALVLEVIQHTDDVKTVVMQPVKRCPVFKPGQFLHLAMDPYDPSSNWPESRVFSIASSPMRREMLKIIFSVKGKFTRRMFDEIKKGDEIYVKLPYGSFTFPEDDRGLVLVAGGTGITPFLSYLEYAIDLQMKRNILLYHGIRDPGHLVCGPLLSQCQETLRNFKCYCYLERGTDLTDIKAAGKGFIPLEEILHQRNVMPEALYYLSGPPEMVTNFKGAIVSAGVPQGQVLVDEWE